MMVVHWLVMLRASVEAAVKLRHIQARQDFIVV